MWKLKHGFCIVYVLKKKKKVAKIVNNFFMSYA